MKREHLFARISLAVALVVCLSALVAWAVAAENVDLDMAGKIRAEEFRNSKVMDILGELCDRIGPRLTASPAMKKANDWTRDQLTSYGLVNAHLESFPFGRGWSNEMVSVRVTSPFTASLIAAAKAWTPGTSGPGPR